MSTSTTTVTAAVAAAAAAAAAPANPAQVEGKAGLETRTELTVKSELNVNGRQLVRPGAKVNGSTFTISQPALWTKHGRVMVTWYYEPKNKPTVAAAAAAAGEGASLFSAPPMGFKPSSKPSTTPPAYTYTIGFAEFHGEINRRAWALDDVPDCVDTPYSGLVRSFNNKGGWSLKCEDVGEDVVLTATQKDLGCIRTHTWRLKPCSEARGDRIVQSLLVDHVFPDICHASKLTEPADDEYSPSSSAPSESLAALSASLGAGMTPSGLAGLIAALHAHQSTQH